MTPLLSLTGKLWREPSTVLDVDSLASFADALATRRQLGDHQGTGNWYEPSAYPDAQKAAARTEQAIRDQENIAIFGDYDADGITATALLLRFFRRRGIEPLVRLPHRIADGYGIKPAHIKEFLDVDITLLFTVDTGIGAYDALAEAKANGVDVIVLDHHHVTTPPPAYAILHPSLAPDFAGAHPSAAGVVFSFLHAMETEAWADRDTDTALAAIGTVADVVSLTGGNRRLVREGLAALARLTDTPLATLVSSVSKGLALTSTDIAFRIAPRINAAGRMANPTLALTALLEGGSALAELEKLNSERQLETQRCIDDALLSIDAQNPPPFLFVASDMYPSGILGLIAGRLAERFGRPAMAAAIHGDTCTASLRSPACYNIIEGLARHAELFVTFGGHAQAAGATFQLSHLEEIRSVMSDDVATHVTAEELNPTMAIDAELPLPLITPRFSTSLSTLEPYGQGNIEPLFLSRGVTLTFPRTVGHDGKHLQAHAGHFKLIGFGMGEHLEHATKPLDIVYRLGIDSWNGKNAPQLFLQDLRISQ